MREETLQLFDARYPRPKILLVREDAQRFPYPAEFGGTEDLVILESDSCEAAMRFVERQDFDLVVVQQGSPAFMAHELCRHMNQCSPCVPYVLFTSRNNLALYLHAFAMAWRACEPVSA